MSGDTMNWLDRQIAKIAPAVALKRAVARNRLDRIEQAGSTRGAIEAVSGARTRAGMLSSFQSPDAAVKNDIAGLRAQVRHLEFNNGFVSGPIRRIVNNVVGTGIRFQARVRPSEKGVVPAMSKKAADKINRAAEAEFKKWNKQADKKLTLSFYEIQRLACGALERDGECLVVLRTSNRRDRRVPLCLEGLECDRLATPMEEISNPKIRNGIEFDQEGVPKTYFVMKHHPGDDHAAALGRAEFQEIPAFKDGVRKVIHLYDPVRFEQTRGFSRFASAWKDYQNLDRYIESEEMAALEDACMVGIVTTPDPVGFQSGMEFPGVKDKLGLERLHGFSPNTFMYARPGEKVDIHSPKRPNDAFGAFVEQILRGPANALDIPPEVLSQNWHNMNYSNARTVLLQFYRSCMVRQAYLIEHLCEPVYQALFRWLLIKGLVQAPCFISRPDDCMAHAWIPPGWPWVDPVKEANGKKIELENLFSTLSDVCASRGRDFEETVETRARELAKIKELEERWGVTLTSLKAAVESKHQEAENDSQKSADRAQSGSVLSLF